MTIYVVYGSTGEYPDHEEWPVRAFMEKRKAEWFVLKADERAAEIAERSRRGRMIMYNSDTGEKSEYDPSLRIDYTGTNYAIWEVELELNL